jgi:hypothetical protein
MRADVETHPYGVFKKTAAHNILSKPFLNNSILLALERILHGAAQL